MIIRNIPVFTNSNLSECRRFINLIDTFYDQKVRVLCSSENEIDSLFRLSDDNEEGELSAHHRKLMDDLNLNMNEVKSPNCASRL